MFGVPTNTLPMVMYIRIFCLLYYCIQNMSFKTIFRVGLMVLSDGLVYFLKIENLSFFSNPPKLSCGCHEEQYKAYHRIYEVVIIAVGEKIHYFRNYIEKRKIHTRIQAAPPPPHLTQRIRGRTRIPIFSGKGYFGAFVSGRLFREKNRGGFFFFYANGYQFPR